MTITVSVNGVMQECPLPITVADALQQWGYDSVRVAVAINGEFVPRSTYGTHTLVSGDDVDVVAAVQGG
ncbi:MAG TPA: sulfur carrier protein ThiS [Pseudomonadales bacterium]|jgi:sulfur carrier protein